MDVLIVDDAPDIRLLARTVIERCGCRVVAEAESCETGLAAWREHRPALVLLDIILPDGSGVDLLKTIVGESPEQAVVMLTTVADDQVMLDCLKSGAGGYLLKDERTWLKDLAHRLALYRKRTGQGDEDG